MSWDAELIHSVMTPGADKWWNDEHPHEKRKCLEEPVWPLSTINLNARTLSDQARRVTTTQWEYFLPPPVLSHLDFPFFGMLRCPDSAVTWGSHSLVPRCRVTSAGESESLVPPRHYLESYHYQQPGSARTKLLTQTFAHSVSISSTRTLTW